MRFERDEELDENLISAHEGTEVLGFLNYEAAGSDYFYLNGVQVTLANRQSGIGTELVKEFVKDIGTNKRISTMVSHEPSIEAIKRLGLLEGITKERDLRIIGPADLFNQIPVMRVLARGGITIEMLKLSANPDSLPTDSRNDDYIREVIGKTRALK